MRVLTMILILVVGVFVLTGFACGDGDKTKPAEGQKPNTVETTAKGATINSKSGTSAEIKNMIDASMTEVFADAKAAYNYQNKMSHSDYTVYVEDGCVLSPVDKLLSFKISAPDYNGTIYDVNPDPNIGEVYAAEMVVQVRGEDWGMKVVPEYIMCNDTSVSGSEAARNGPEHILHYFNDMVKFNETVYHGSGISHPIIPHRGRSHGTHSKQKPAKGKSIKTEKGTALIVR